MIKKILFPAFVLGLAACGAPDAQPSDQAATTSDDAAAVSDEAPLDESMPPVDPGTPEEVLQSWAHGLESRDWEAARLAWGNAGEDSGMSAEEFADAYSKYKTIKITVGEGRTEGAAGSLYYETQVVMEGELENGDAYRLEGPVVLRRVNDVPGSSTEQRKWHIATSDLRAVPVDETSENAQ
ncbi:hypothetical protein [Henriciella litoralis]|uniref:hypothetical protein n=1 Tax=Henriciella litoralis TaxID=568102 RepID=UPI0009FC9DD0|nr:hypothetical protein [Henriciella litoralis]